MKETTEKRNTASPERLEWLNRLITNMSNIIAPHGFKRVSHYNEPVVNLQFFTKGRHKAAVMFSADYLDTYHKVLDRNMISRINLIEASLKSSTDLYNSLKWYHHVLDRKRVRALKALIVEQRHYLACSTKIWKALIELPFPKEVEATGSESSS